MIPTVGQMKLISRGRASHTNIVSIIKGLEAYPAGITVPHRLVHYLAQLGHESGGFFYDREVWGPTPAQARYDTRTDLGNTPERDGDGELYKGRTGLQITGKDNYISFRNWCRAKGLNPPDFEKYPDKVNEDPWEGLGPIWFWETRNINRMADENNIEWITKTINGGLNGYADRIRMYDRAALVLLGYGPEAVKVFQTESKAAGIYDGELDGDSGPKTRAALHKHLVNLGDKTIKTKAAPITEEVAVIPKGSDKRQGTWIATIVAGIGAPFAAFAGMDTTGKIIVVGVVVASIGFLLWRGEIIVRRVKALVNELD